MTESSHTVGRKELLLWRTTHREATAVLLDMAATGLVDWDEVLEEQQLALERILFRQDRHLSHERVRRVLHRRGLS